MSFGGFVLAATLYVSLVIIFISIGLHLLSFRFRSQQNRMLYYPEMPPESREECEDPVALGMPNSERVTVVTADKVRLRGFMLWPSGLTYGQKSCSGVDASVAGAMGTSSNSTNTNTNNINNGGNGLASPPQAPTNVASATAAAVAVAVGASGAGQTAAAAMAHNNSNANREGNGGDMNAGSPPHSTSPNAMGSTSAVHTPSAGGGAAAVPFVLLYFHGNAGNVGHRLSLAQGFVSQLKCAVMMVDYRGFGLSDDAEPIQEGLELDAQACFDYLWQDHRVPRDRIVVMGTSLGGAVAIHLASHEKYARRVQAVIVENTFTSIGDMASALGRPVLTKLVASCPGLAVGLFDYYIKPLALRIGWRSIRKIRRIVAPMLFLSGGQDELVPPVQMRQLYKESTKCLRDGNNSELTVPLRRFQEFENGAHNNLPLMPGYMSVIQQFMVDVNQGRSSGVV